MQPGGEKPLLIRTIFIVSCVSSSLKLGQILLYQAGEALCRRSKLAAVVGHALCFYVLLQVNVSEKKGLTYWRQTIN